MAYANRTSGFLVKAKEVIDRRLVLSKQEMKDSKFADGTSFKLFLPAKTSKPAMMFAFCLDDKQFYYYHADNAESAETGKWAKLELGSGAPTAGVGPVSGRPNAEDGKPGDKWYDPETGKTYIIVADSEGNQTWVETTPEAGEMLYDSTNNVILYFDGTEWKPIGGGVEKVETLPAAAEEGKIYFDSEGQYKVYEDGVWFTLAKTWEGTEAQYTALGGDTYSQAHPDVVFYITD